MYILVGPLPGVVDPEPVAAEAVLCMVIAVVDADISAKVKVFSFFVWWVYTNYPPITSNIVRLGGGPARRGEGRFRFFE